MIMNRTHPQLRALATSIDQAFHHFYESSSDIDINDYVYIEDSDSSSLAEVLALEHANTLHLSLRFSPGLSQYFTGHECPSVRLTSGNLGLLAIIAEEVSHFHCMCQAAAFEIPVSRFDLELQAEFDKFLISSLFLKKQTGASHPVQLARLLFDSSTIYQNADIYQRANNIAASWWWSQINQHGNDLLTARPELLASLKKLRHIHGQAKLEALSKLKARNFKHSA